MKKVIVTGAAGFIGSHLVEYLKKRGDMVLAVDTKLGSDLNSADNIDWMHEKMSAPDVIVNLAGTCSTPRGFTHPSEAMANNTLSAFHVMRFAAEIAKCPVIHTSTCKAEPDAMGMYTPYGLTKLFGEMTVREWDKCFGVPSIINRPGTIYGPGQHGSTESGWLAWFITAALTGQEITINGDGNFVRDPLYVSDYINLLVHQIDNFQEYRDLGQDYFSIGGGIENRITILEAAEYINSIVPLKWNFGPERKGDISDLYVRSGPWGSAWETSVSWKEGIKRTIEFYQQHKELL